MEDTLKVIEGKSSGLSDTVWLAIVAGIVALATLIIKAIIEAQAKKAEAIAAAAVAAAAAIAAAEAEKVTKKLEAVEVKIDGRLTQLLESYKREGELKELKGHQEGKEEGKKEEQEKAPAPPTGLHETGPLKLTITEGEMKVVPETTKKKPK